jgi:hypothetical protein
MNQTSHRSLLFLAPSLDEALPSRFVPAAETDRVLEDSKRRAAALSPRGPPPPHALRRAV